MVIVINIRERYEKREKLILSQYASMSTDSKGRMLDEEKCSVRTDYQRDRDRIIHSKSFRRLKHKTQVFLSPEGDHYRTRLTHTLEVSQISRTIARALELNEDLTEAIALGHDLGHTPFGHCGEAELNRIHPAGFHHNEQSLRIVDVLEKRNGKESGLNLTKEVRDGILHHNGSESPSTLEGQIVKLSDRIAYLNHDIDDAIRAGVMKPEDLPRHVIERLGKSQGDRINTLILNTIETSKDYKRIRLSEDINEVFLNFRSFMFEKVYYNNSAKGEEYRAELLLQVLYDYFNENPDQMPIELSDSFKSIGSEAVKDYIASMSDRYAVNKFKDIYIPKFWLY